MVIRMTLRLLTTERSITAPALPGAGGPHIDEAARLGVALGAAGPAPAKKGSMSATDKLAQNAQNKELAVAGRSSQSNAAPWPVPATTLNAHEQQMMIR